MRFEFLANHRLLWLRFAVISLSHFRVIPSQYLLTGQNLILSVLTHPSLCLLCYYKVHSLHTWKNAPRQPKNQALWSPLCAHVDIYLRNIRIKQRTNISLCRQATYIRTKLSVIIFLEWGRSRESFVQKPTGVAACCERTKWWRDKLKASLKGGQIAFS